MDPTRGYPPGTPAGTPTTPSWRHEAHGLAGLVVFVALPAACRTLVPRLKRPWRVYALATAAVGLVLFLWFGAAWELGAGNAGLIKRALITVDLSLVALPGARLLRSL